MALTAEQIAEQLRLKKEADAKKAAAEKAAAEKAAAELLKKQILQELDQINKATPTDPTEKAAAFAEIDAMSATYGGTLVQDILVELGATNGILPGDVLGAYTRAGGAPGGRARQTAINKRRAELAGLTPEEQAAAKAAATLNKKDKLKDSDSVVRPDDQTEGLKGEAYINLTSQTHQCILQHYMEDVAKYHRSEISRDASKNELNELLDRTFAPFAPSGKQKIILIDDKDPNSSVAPINALTSLGKTSGLSKLLPADLAKAMPKIRLYKIYRKKGKETGKIEFRFPTATDRGFLTNVTDSYSGSEGDDFTMTAGYAKGRAVGIKSFDWSFIGGDPFTATKDLTAKLTIFFQDFRDLTTVHHGANLLKRAGGPLEPYKYLDLIVQPDCRKGATIPANTGAPVPNTTKKEMVFNPDCYEIAVEVGYADTPGLPKALKNNDTLYLTMQEHSFDIGQDGTFSLSIDYRARLASLLGDKGMNVLSPAGGYMIKDDEDSTGLVFDIREVEQKIEEEESRSKPNKKNLDALIATKKHLLYVRNNGFYRSITMTLLKEKLVYNLSVPTETFNKFTNFANYSRGDGKSKLVGIDDAPALKPGDISPTTIDPDFITIDIATAALESGDERAPLSERPPTGDGVKRYQYISYKEKLRDALKFTTVGNIIAVALEHILGETAFSIGTQGDIKDLVKIHKAAMKDFAEDESENQKAAEEAAAEITAGDTVEIYDDVSTRTQEGQYDMLPGKVTVDPTGEAKLDRFRVILGSISYEDAKTGKMKAINIAHLPVSMQMFRQFMIDRVISNQRAFYSFQDFVRDVLTDIVFDSLQRICFGGYTEGAKIRTGISLFNALGVNEGGAEEPISSQGPGSLIYGFKRKRAEKAVYKTLSPSAAKASNPIFKSIPSPAALDFNYLMFSAFSVAILNKNLHGDEGEDNDSGIAHFRYGSTTGMMKSVNFTKTPIEYLAEERYVREGTDNLLNQLAGRYEMQMSLAGNNMFIPGQYVYFDPVALGIGKSMANTGTNRSLANLMGLGGYHIITEVGCSIAPGKFETTIKALWETGGTPKP